MTSEPQSTLAARDDGRTREELFAEIAQLRARLAEPEETLRAIRHGEVDAFVVLDPSGERVYALATEEVLRLLHLVTDAMPMLVSYVDREERYRFANQRYGAWFGFAAGEINGAKLADVLGDSYASIRQHVREALSGREVTFERWLPHRTQGRRNLRAIYVPHVQTGVVEGFVAFVEDVTERQRATTALRILADAGELLAAWPRGEESLADAASLAVPAFADFCLIDLLRADGGSERIVSLHHDPARQALMEELQSHPPLWESESVQAKVLRSGETLLLPILTSELMRTQTNSERHSQIAGLLAPGSAICAPLVVRGRRLGTLSFLYADSERRYAAADVPLARELARRIAVALEKSRLFRELEWANSAKDHFLAALSHELRTPLAPVLAIASRLDLDGSVPEGLRSDLQVIRRNVELEARLIDDLLDLTRITRGKLDLHRELCDLRQVLQQAIETCGEGALEDRHLTLDLSAPDHVVWGDPARLTQVFWNLLHNALKFTPKGGAIVVRSFRDEIPDFTGDAPIPLLVVQVEDSGAGIAADELPRIFDAFERGRGAEKSSGGLGLGLAISRSIVDLHGGRVSAASAGTGRGATLTVRLPLEIPEIEVLAEAVESAMPPAAQAPLHILLVEDHADTAEAMAHLLEQMGHRVTVTGTVAGSLAAAAAAAGGLDLVVSDLGLPDGDGYDVMRALAPAGVPGIALSGYGMEEDIAMSREAGFSLHLTKPVNLQALRDAIGRIIAPRTAEP